LTNTSKLNTQSALEVFATYGFHGATIDHIAQNAEISKPNLLYCYRNKEHIYSDLLGSTMLDGSMRSALLNQMVNHLKGSANTWMPR
jgi:AcrR family transcriptional regulator